MSYETATLEELKAHANARDRTAYYSKLVSLHDPYGAMALGVVKQSNIAGVVARCYAIAVSRRCCRLMDDTTWLAISNDLMLADLEARNDADNFEPGTPSLLWNVVRDYHVSVFGNYNYPPETWTAWIPLHVDGDGNAPGLWHRMVTGDFLTVAVQTVWLVAGRAVHRNAAATSMDLDVAFGLQHHPPVATGIPPDAKTAACMAELASSPLSTSGTTSKRASCRILPVRPRRGPGDDDGYGSNRTNVRLAVQAVPDQPSLLRRPDCSVTAPQAKPCPDRGLADGVV